MIPFDDDEEEEFDLLLWLLFVLVTFSILAVVEVVLDTVFLASLEAFRLGAKGGTAFKGCRFFRLSFSGEPDLLGLFGLNSLMTGDDLAEAVGLNFRRPK